MFKTEHSRNVIPKCPVSTTPLAGKKILVLEDEPILALEFEESLYAAGAERVELCFCISPKTMEAVSRATVALLDLDIQGKSSAPVAAELERLGIPFVIVTGHSDDAFDKSLMQHPRFTKPINMPELIGFISQV